ncbi:fibulin-7-like precursor [Danio rerio]|uniref:Fibulin-7-like precursor n=1 Tax=Danio rerio TaxID=7955 RepID=E7F9K6_DANRE|nr:fibulin-7-like precursor [Danio rerio]|eukprot:XP_017209808.2 fibulin-7-like [Danio rerio]
MMMKLLLCVWIIFSSQLSTSQAQECEVVNSALQQMMKTLSAHEISLRSLQKTLKQMQNTRTHSTACPPPPPLMNGRVLGRIFRMGHEIHYLCDAGFQRMGPESRVCLQSLSWSDTQPSCQRRISPVLSDADTEGSAMNDDDEPTALPTSSTFSSSSSSSLLSSSSSTVLSSVYLRASRCVEFLDSIHCSCDAGFSISSSNTSFCMDIDECELFRHTPPGRVCAHTCVNTAGSFYCRCPDGYKLSRDSRSCHDVDECVQAAHNCSSEQVCVNTYGGHRCEHIHCPEFHNATYIRTSALRCERSPCVEEDSACLQAPLSVSFHFMSVVSNMRVPVVLFRVSAERLLGDSLRFSLQGNSSVQRVSIQRSGPGTARLVLLRSIQGPDQLTVDIQIDQTEKRRLIGRYLTRVTLFISPYDF